MTFTDDDLKRLKEALSVDASKLPGKTHTASFTLAQIKGLLARLEAAEKALGTDCYANGDCVLCKVHHEAYLKWRKAAGK